MACFNPLKAFPIGTTDLGKIKYKVCSQNVDHLEKDRYGNWQKRYDDFIAANYGMVKSHINVPCGKCIGCRLDQSQMWAYRCMMELQYHDEAWFVTLTYDDEHLPKARSFDSDTGELREVPTLVKKDFQDFIKRLRKNYKGDNKLRYYMAGEYGSNTYRPHYHAIIFGLHLDDLEFYKDNELGNHLYNSKFLSDCWQNKGFVVAGEVTWESCAYTARYVMKKQHGDNAAVYQDFNIQPEFTLMSNKPGIAAQYYYDHPNLLDYDEIAISTEQGGKKCKPPRYFKKLKEKMDPQNVVPFYEKLNSESMQVARSVQRAKLDRTSLDKINYLKTEESVKAAQIKSLRRKGVM